MSALCALLALLLAALAARAPAQGFFPCHPAKSNVNNQVSCSRVVMPDRLCKRCPLRPTGPDGNFEQCSRIYDTESDDCHDALQEYVAENAHCDPVRADAVPALLDGDDDARQVVDYFLYSVCELCCDCIPMGTEKQDFPALQAAHSPTDPALWREDRGNCPAHAHFDICKVLPHATYFTKKGGPEVDAPKGCPLLRAWQQSPDFSQWETNPSTNIVPELKSFLRSALVAIDCEDFGIWGTCYEMEEKQNHLDLPKDYLAPTPDAPATEPPATTTTATSVTTTTSTETSTSTSTTTTTTSQTTTTSTDATTTATTTTATTTSSASTSTTTTTDIELVPSDPPSDTASAAVGDPDTTAPPPPAQDATSASGATCFPASATVELQSGQRVPMSRVRIGDAIRVGESTFSEVFLFSHRTATSASAYIQITAGNSTLSVTPGHYVYANSRLLAAQHIASGDVMRTTRGPAVVTDVRRVHGAGLYNPQTVHGDIVVDGFVASTYTTAVPRSVATALLAPFRALFAGGMLSEKVVGGFLSEGYRSLVPWKLEL